MKRNPTNQKLKSLLRLINKLTQDEDTKQDLLLLYLEGNTSQASIEKLAAKVNITQSVEANRALIDLLINSNHSDSLIALLESLTDQQREAVLLHSSGVSFDDISRYNGISRQKVEQLIKSIGFKYGSKETLHR